MAGIFGGDSTGLLGDPNAAAGASIAQGGPPLAPGISPQQLTQLSDFNPSNPAVAAAVNAPGGLWDRLKGAIGSGQLPGALKDTGSAFQNPQPLARPPLTPPMPPHLAGYNPYRSMYRPPVLSAKDALQQLMRGY